MRKILWEVKSILNKREKHLRGRHDQRDHNRWPAGYQAQTYTPSSRRAAVMQGRGSDFASSMAAPKKVALPSGVTQTSIFDEPVIAPTPPSKSQQEQILDDIRSKSRAMYARTDSFVGISDRMVKLISNADGALLTPAESIFKFFSRFSTIAVNLDINIAAKKWYKKIDYENLRQKLNLRQQPIGGNIAAIDDVIEGFKILGEFHQYQDELAETSESLANSIKSFTLIYKEKREEASKIAEQARNINSKYEANLDNLIKDVLFRENTSDEEAKISEEHSVAQSAVLRSMKNLFKLDVELDEAETKLEEIKKQEASRRNLRRGGTTVVGTLETDSLTQMVKIANIRDKISIEKQTLAAAVLQKDNLKKEFIKINNEAQEMSDKNKKEIEKLYAKEHDISKQYPVLQMYTEIFSAMSRDDGLENVTLNGIDAFSDKENWEKLIRTIFRMMPKNIANDDNARIKNGNQISSDQTEIGDIQIDFKLLPARERAQHTVGERKVVDEKFQGKSTIELTNTDGASTLSHEIIHAIQSAYGHTFWMHLMSYINKKTGRVGYSNIEDGTVPIRTLNALSKKRDGTEPYRRDEKGYDTDLSSEYTFKVSSGSGYNKYTELREIHTQAITDLINISTNPDAEILNYFVQSILGMPSTGSGMFLLDEMIQHNLASMQRYKETVGIAQKPKPANQFTMIKRVWDEKKRKFVNKKV